MEGIPQKRNFSPPDNRRRRLLGPVGACSQCVRLAKQQFVRDPSRCTLPVAVDPNCKKVRHSTLEHALVGCAQRLPGDAGGAGRTNTLYACHAARLASDAAQPSANLAAVLCGVCPQRGECRSRLCWLSCLLSSGVKMRCWVTDGSAAGLVPTLHTWLLSMFLQFGQSEPSNEVVYWPPR